MSIACGPTWETQPMITSSTAAGSMPVRETTLGEHVGAQVGRMHACEAAVATADRGPDGSDYVCLRHDDLHCRASPSTAHEVTSR